MSSHSNIEQEAPGESLLYHSKRSYFGTIKHAWFPVLYFHFIQIDRPSLHAQYSVMSTLSSLN